MSTIYEINMSNARADVNTGRVKQDSKIVEVFSALFCSFQTCVCR